MTEREVFEAHGEMMGWDLSKGEDDQFNCFEVNCFWKGWKLRADIQRAVELEADKKLLLSVSNLIPSPFTSAQTFGSLLSGGQGIYKRLEGE